MTGPKYYFNVSTKQVEQGNQSGALHLLGPYDSYAEAAAALDRAARRTAAWDEQDERERGWGGSGPGEEPGDGA